MCGQNAETYCESKWYMCLIIGPVEACWEEGNGSEFSHKCIEFLRLVYNQ